MVWLSRSRARGTTAKLFLAVIATLLAAILIVGGIANAQRGDGGRGGGEGGGKPSGASKSSPGSKSSSAEKAGDKGLPSGVANSSSRYYNCPNYGIRHGALSNFFLWAWLFHDFDDEYEEEYIQSNYDFEGWAILGVVAVGAWFLIRNLRKRSKV
jgi:hypothetical protein